MSTADKPIEARRYVVRGRVQGVGFRWFVEREAVLLGVAGWVRNLPDGGVEVLAQGNIHQLAGLRSRLREGPRAARVDSVEDFEAQPIAGVTSFRIEGAW
jgi:acylphosphatase